MMDIRHLTLWYDFNFTKGATMKFIFLLTFFMSLTVYAEKTKTPKKLDIPINKEIPNAKTITVNLSLIHI